MNQEVIVQFPVGHMPRLWAPSPLGGVQEAPIDDSLSSLIFLSLSLSLKINKNIFLKNKMGLPQNVTLNLYSIYIGKLLLE